MRTLDMPIKDREARNAAKRAYYERNREACKAKMRAYMKTERGRATFRASRLRYAQSEKGKAARRRRQAAWKQHADNRFKVKLRDNYGLTVEQWHAMLVEQAGRCAICQQPMRKPHVDHRHSDGLVRALLCSPCNFLVGAVERAPHLVDAALMYVGRFA